jgi:excisionase family DNA binding protein
MFRLSPSTTTAIALHATEQSWIVFVQCRPPAGLAPIKIEGIRARDFIPRTRALNLDSPFETHLIGLLPTDAPQELELALHGRFAEEHLRDGWFTPSGHLANFIDESATDTLRGLLALVHPAAVEDGGAVSIEEMAELLGVAVVTVRRMVKAEQIPHLRWGRTLRFIPSDVFASLQAR